MPGMKREGRSEYFYSKRLIMISNSICYFENTIFLKILQKRVDK